MSASADFDDLDGLRRLDPQIISAVFDHYYPDVYRFVRYRLNDEKTAEDIASDVFVRLLEAVRSGRPPETNLKAWLLGTAAHVVTDQLRRSYRQPSSKLPESLPGESPDPSLDYEQKERGSHLKAALVTLTDEQQNVIVMRFGQGLSLEETALAMKKNINAIKQLQFRALVALNRRMSEIS